MRTHCVVLFCSLTAGACGGGSPDAQSSGSSPRDPAPKPAVRSPAQSVAACSLFTKAEIEGALGQPVSEGRQEEMAELSTCQYDTVPGPDTPPGGLLTVGIFTGTRPGQAKGVYDIAKSNAAKVEEVSGVGDEAYWDDILKTMRVVKADYQIDISFGMGAGGLQVARSLAEKTLAKLP